MVDSKRTTQLAACGDRKHKKIKAEECNVNTNESTSTSKRLVETEAPPLK